MDEVDEGLASRLTVVQTEPDEAPVDWEALYRANVDLVYRFAYSQCGNRPDSEDITAKVFTRALPRLRSGASEGEARSYLVATTRTVLADHWREHYALSTKELDPDLPHVVAEESDNEPASERATELLGRLPERHKRVLELRFLRGYSLKETAHALGISVANVKVTQWRALRQAAQMFEEDSQ